jgi:hypothetical protein
MTPEPLQSPEVSEEAPPFLRTWNRVYAAVLIYLFLLILLLYAVTRIFQA